MAMRRPHRSIEVFDISLMAVVTKAMGAFLVMMLILLPYYSSDPANQVSAEKLKSQLTAAKEQLEAALKRLGGTTEDPAELKRRLDEAVKLLEDARAQLGLLQSDLDHAWAQVKRAQDVKQELEGKLADLEAKMAPLKARLAELEAQIADLQAQISPLKAENDRLKGELAPLQQKLAELQGQNADLQAQVAPLKAEIDQLKNELAPLRQQVADLQAQAALVAPLQAQNAQLQAEIDNLRAQIQQLQAQQGNAGQMQAQIDQMQQQMQSKDEQISNLQQQIDKLNTSDIVTTFNATLTWWGCSGDDWDLYAEPVDPVTRLPIAVANWPKLTLQKDDAALQPIKVFHFEGQLKRDAQGQWIAHPSRQYDVWMQTFVESSSYRIIARRISGTDALTTTTCPASLLLSMRSSPEKNSVYNKTSNVSWGVQGSGRVRLWCYLDFSAGAPAMILSNAEQDRAFAAEFAELDAMPAPPTPDAPPDPLPTPSPQSNPTP